MAGGKQTPRQKMINLMYLVFIAMLALNMSKEVLAAFGTMNERFEDDNAKKIASNDAFLESLEIKKGEDPTKYEALYNKAEQVKTLSKEYYNYLEELKTAMTADVDDPKDYQVMDKADYLDNEFFEGEGYKPAGKEFINRVNNYREAVLKVIDGEKMTAAEESIKGRFNTDEVKNREEIMVPWLEYNYKGYPLIASLTKITQLQNDIQATEQDILSGMLQGNYQQALALNTYSTLLQPSKTAFYAGEKFSGRLAIGKTDASATPKRAELKLDGRSLSEGRDYKLVSGGVELLFGAGNAGDHELSGKLFYDQDGEETEVEVTNSRFSTINKPNAANIAADKMNVVYRGVANPMTISIPGIAEDKVNATAPGLRRVRGSKYIMNPGSGREVTINASGVLPDGTTIRTPAKFRIKDIPRPSGTLRGEAGSVKMPRRNLEIATVGAMLEDFDFELTIAVSEFKFKVPGQPTVVVKGNRMNAQAKSAIRRAKRGDNVQIFDIKAYVTNNRNYKLKKVSPVVVELTN